MNEVFDLLADYSDNDLLRLIAVCVVGLFGMRMCQWVYVACKWLHDWLSSLFPTSLDRK